MKYILSLIVCSSVSSTCMPPVTSNIMYENMLDKTTESLEKIIKNAETPSNIQQ